jgi:hypothetical protein
VPPEEIPALVTRQGGLLPAELAAGSPA